MTSPLTIELTINMPDGGRHARQLLNFYFEDMPADINASALTHGGANQALQAHKFANLALKRADAWAGPEGSLKVFALLTVSSEDPGFVKQVIASYMDGFPAYLKKAGGRYFSHSGFPPEIPLQPTDWSVEVR